MRRVVEESDERAICLDEHPNKVVEQRGRFGGRARRSSVLELSSQKVSEGDRDGRYKRTLSKEEIWKASALPRNVPALSLLPTARVVYEDRGFQQTRSWNTSVDSQQAAS